MKKNNFFIIFIILLIVVVIALGWYRYVYQKDYWLYSVISCNPNTESCFYSEESESHYKIARIKAYAIGTCDGWNNECKEISCESFSSIDCQTFTCNKENVERFATDTECTSEIIE